MDNENLVKKGYLKIAMPSNGFFKNFKNNKHKKQWRSKKFFALYKSSFNGIQRLEVFTNEKSYLKGGPLLQKIIPLNNCFRVVQMSQKDQANVFEIHTKESIKYFSAESYLEMNDWLKCLQCVAFGLNRQECDQTKQATGECKQTNVNNEKQDKLNDVKSSPALINEENKKTSLPSKTVHKNEENVLYCSIDKKQQHFKVTIRKTEAAIRCALHIHLASKSNEHTTNSSKNSSISSTKDCELPAKYYYLIFNSTSLNLIEDPNRTNVILFDWNFRNIRRYGCTIDTFSIEVGRKSKSGAGLFLFNTKEGCTIFHQLAKYVNDLKHVTLNNHINSPIKDSDPNKYRATVINIQPLPIKYDLSRYDSTANSPSSSSSIKSNESSILSDSTTSNDFTSLNEKSVENDGLFKNSSTDQRTSIDNVSFRRIPNISLPVAKSINSLTRSNKFEQNKENLTSKVNYTNPFLINYEEVDRKTFIGTSRPILTSCTKRFGIQGEHTEDVYNDVQVSNLEKCRDQSKQMNKKMSSCSVANLIEGERLSHFNKLNKSLPHINKIGNDQINHPLLAKPNSLIKPPRMSKLMNEEKCYVSPPKEEPIFESRQELFGYQNEENPYEIADDGSEHVDTVKSIEQPNNEILDSIKLSLEKSNLVKSNLTKSNLTRSESSLQANESPTDSLKRNQISKPDESQMNLLSIDTYELLVSTLNKIDEKSLNTLKEAIKKVLNENSVPESEDKNRKNQNSEQNGEFFKNLLLSNQQASINYVHNDCEYAKIMKKKFMKKTIVEHF